MTGKAGKKVRPAGCAGLNLSRIGGNCQIGDEGILCFPASVADDCLITVFVNQLLRIAEELGDVAEYRNPFQKV